MWLEYLYDDTKDCPFGGHRDDAQLLLRAGGPKAVRFGSVGKALAADPAQGQIDDLWGVSFEAQPACDILHTRFGCYWIDRRFFQHTLATTPPTLLPVDELRLVTTPKGDFDVLWTAATEESMRDARCADRDEVRAFTAFAASRR